MPSNTQTAPSLPALTARTTSAVSIASSTMATRSLASEASVPPCAEQPPLTGGNSATSSPSSSTTSAVEYSRFTATATLSSPVPIAGLDERSRKTLTSSPTVAPSGSSNGSSAAPKRSFSTPKYNTRTRICQEYRSDKRRRQKKSPPQRASQKNGNECGDAPFMRRASARA